MYDLIIVDYKCFCVFILHQNDFDTFIYQQRSYCKM